MAWRVPVNQNAQIVACIFMITEINGKPDLHNKVKNHCKLVALQTCISHTDIDFPNFDVLPSCSLPPAVRTLRHHVTHHGLHELSVTPRITDFMFTRWHTLWFRHQKPIYRKKIELPESFTDFYDSFADRALCGGLGDRLVSSCKLSRKYFLLWVINYGNTNTKTLPVCTNKSTRDHR